MFLSSSAVVIIDPFASLLMGVTCPVLIYIMEKYLPFILIKGYNIDAIIICTLGAIFDSIFTAGRNSRTPSLSDNCAKQGGLQFASLLVTICFSALLGLFATLILRCFNPRQSINKDNMIWFIDQETLPIYKDDPIFKKLMGENTDTALKQENLLFNLKNSYITEK
jgi:hypothetical protein